jgi:hypothetical protein
MLSISNNIVTWHPKAGIVDPEESPVGLRTTNYSTVLVRAGSNLPKTDTKASSNLPKTDIKASSNLPKTDTECRQQITALPSSISNGFMYTRKRDHVWDCLTYHIYYYSLT